MNKFEIRFFAEKIKPQFRQDSDTSSNNILDIIDFIKKSNPNIPLTLDGDRIVNQENILKELNEPLSQVILIHGNEKWIITKT